MIEIFGSLLYFFCLALSESEKRHPVSTVTWKELPPELSRPYYVVMTILCSFIILVLASVGWTIWAICGGIPR